MRSASLKSFVLRAALRASISVSMRSESQPPRSFHLALSMQRNSVATKPRKESCVAISSRSLSMLDRKVFAFRGVQFRDHSRRVQIIQEGFDDAWFGGPFGTAWPRARNQSSSVVQRLLESLHGPVDRLTVVRLQHREPQHLPCQAHIELLVSSSLIVTKLPSDFAILSPSTCRKPLCIQNSPSPACGRRNAICAISFS